MRVALFDGPERRPIDFDPAAHKWKQQSGKYLVGLPTGLASPAETFVKKWTNAYAPGHKLLLGAISNPLPFTPAVLGHGAQDHDHYYFLENLPANYQLVDDIITRGTGEVALKKKLSSLLIDKNFGLTIATSAAHLFAAVNRRGFVYTDFANKNVMIDWRAGKCRLIDMDSCIPASDLSLNMTNKATAFSIVYWGAWRALGNPAAEALSQTMILSFAAVWARATLLIRSAPARIEAVQKLLKTPSYGTTQSALWKSLLADDRGAFKNYFGFAQASDSDPLYQRWHDAVAALRARRSLPWATVRGIVERTFELARIAAPAKVGKAPQVSTPPIIFTIPTTVTAPPTPVPAPVPPPGLSKPRDGTDGIGLPDGLAEAFAGFEGRLARGWYALYLIALLVGGVVAILVTPSVPDKYRGTVAFVLSCGWGWSFVALTVKRAHDYGSKGVLEALPAGVLAAGAILMPRLASPNAPFPESALMIGRVLLLISALVALVLLFVPGDSYENEFD